MKRAFKFVIAAIALLSLSLALAGVGLPEYSHWVHPLGLRGAIGLPHAILFNIGAFLLPGLCLLLAAQGLRGGLQGAGAAARIGLTLVQLSALAFALQGVVQLDQRGVEMLSSRLHVLMWMLWWIAFVPGALLLALSARRGKGFAALCVVAAVLVPLLAVLAPVGAWVGLAQRLAFAVWFGWWLGAARWVGR